jgi:hypothetical protein
MKANMNHEKKSISSAKSASKLPISIDNSIYYVKTLPKGSIWVAQTTNSYVMNTPLSVAPLFICVIVLVLRQTRTWQWASVGKSTPVAEFL